MKTLLNITRFLVGILFIFSGLVKANDPLGLSYKMQEFFEVWHFNRLDSYTLAFSIIMIVFEIVAGVAVLLGWRMKLFSWLLLLLILFFTFLTGYAYLSGKVRECGCFGDCIPLTAGQSFTKDLLLLLLILFIFAYRNKVRPALSNTGSLALLTLSTILSFAFQWFVLQHLPVVDCLPYRKGSNIPEKLKPPPGAITDSTVISFRYEKNGKRVEFTADKFPADFDDSYKLIDRYDKLIRKGNAEPPIKDFVLLTGDGVDTTQDLLQAKGYKLFVFVKTVEEMHAGWQAAFSVVYAMAKSKRMPVYFITADYDNLVAWVDKNAIGDGVRVLKCDATAIKTAARANPTLYLIKQGTILNKWSWADFDRSLGEIIVLPENEAVAQINPPASQ